MQEGSIFNSCNKTRRVFGHLKAKQFYFIVCFVHGTQWIKRQSSKKARWSCVLQCYVEHRWGGAMVSPDVLVTTPSTHFHRQYCMWLIGVVGQNMEDQRPHSPGILEYSFLIILVIICQRISMGLLLKSVEKTGFLSETLTEQSAASRIIISLTSPVLQGLINP